MKAGLKAVWHDGCGDRIEGDDRSVREGHKRGACQLNGRSSTISVTHPCQTGRKPL